jgi:hypothetical protein
MAWDDLADTAVVLYLILAPILLVAGLVSRRNYIRRLSETFCPQCGVPLGWAATRAGVAYYDRLFGCPVEVCGGSPYRRYRVICCPNCQAESVFDGLAYVEPFVPEAITHGPALEPTGEDRWGFTIAFLLGLTSLVLLAVLDGPLWVWFILVPLTTLWGWAAWMNWRAWSKSGRGTNS